MRRDRQALVLLGAYLVAGAGSMPAQLLPFFAAITGQGDRAGLAALGVAAALLFAGQAAASFALPVFRPAGVARGEVGVTALAIPVLQMAAATGNPLAEQFGWVGLGFVSGVFQYVGMMAAARSAAPAAGFVHRAAVGMVISGASIAVFSGFAIGSLRMATAAMAAVQFVLSMIAVGLYRHTPAGMPGAVISPTGSAAVPLGTTALTVVSIAVYFGALIPFLSFLPALFSFSAGSAELAMPFSVARVAAAVLLAVLAGKILQADARLIFALVPVLFGTVIGGWHPGNILGAVVVFFAAEFLLNVLAPKFLGRAVVEVRHAHRWFYMIVLISAAVGQLAVSALAGEGRVAPVVAFACLAAFVPLVWLVLLGRLQGGRRGHSVGG